MSAAIVQPEAQPLTADDRCDRCGAQAYVRATIMGDCHLLFCAHHWREHGDMIRAGGAIVHDETAKLTAPKGVQDDANVV